MKFKKKIGFTNKFYNFYNKKKIKMKLLYHSLVA